MFLEFWPFLLRGVALWSFVVLLLTGVYLTLLFKPNSGESGSTGSYAQPRGLKAAIRSRTTCSRPPGLRIVEGLMRSFLVIASRPVFDPSTVMADSRSDRYLAQPGRLLQVMPGRRRIYGASR